MTEPYRAPKCPVCGWTSAHAPGCPHGSPPPSGEVRALLTAYVDLRRDCIAIEELIERGGELTADDLKRLDKAVTVMKVGFKIVKKVLRSCGIEGCLKPVDEPVLLTPNALQLSRAVRRRLELRVRPLYPKRTNKESLSNGHAHNDTEGATGGA